MPREMSRVWTAPDSPKSVSLAMSIASWSSPNSISKTTGPNSSSWAMADSRSTFSKTTGAMTLPTVSPRTSAFAPARHPASTFFSSAATWRALINGPITVAASAGSPVVRAEALRQKRSRKSVETLECTTMRLADI